MGNRVCDVTIAASSPDNYVHRLVQNKGDGKLVEVMAGQGLQSEEKIDSLQLEVGTCQQILVPSHNAYFFSCSILTC